MLGQRHQRGALAISGVFIALFILTLAAVQLERLRLNSGGTFSEVERTKRLYLARGGNNRFLAQLISSEGENESPLSFDREGYTVTAGLVPESPSPSPTPVPGVAVITKVQLIRARAESEADPNSFQEVTMRILKTESRAPRKFMLAPEAETPSGAQTTIFAYRGKTYPWHVLPPVVMDGSQVARDDVLDIHSGPSGELFCLVRGPGGESLLKIGGLESVLTWSSWENLGPIPSGLTDVVSIIVYEDEMYAIWGPNQSRLSRYDKVTKKWETEFTSADTPIRRLIATASVSSTGATSLTAIVDTKTAYRKDGAWIPLPPPKETNYSENGEPFPTKTDVELDEVLDSALGLYGVWTKDDATTIYYLNEGKWEALPAIPDYYMEDGELKRRPGYAKKIEKVVVDESSGGVVVTLHPPEGPVDIPLTLNEKFKPVPKQYYLGGDLKSFEGNYLNPVPLAVGGPSDFVYSEYSVTGEW